MRILALDLGTKTGYATNVGGTFKCGTWKLATPKEVAAWGESRLTRRGDPRICRLRDHIQELEQPDIIVFEDVQFSSTTMQTQLWSSLRAVVWMFSCAECKTIIEAVPVGTLKKFATGNGTADKEAMMASLVRRVGAIDTSWDDNAIDAYWLYLWAHQNLSRAKL